MCIQGCVLAGVGVYRVWCTLHLQGLLYQQGLPHPVQTRACDKDAIPHGVSIRPQAHVDLFARRKASHALAYSRAQEGMDGSQHH